ncbi:MAG: hypothetical protein ABWY80_02645 [Acidimicrobiia bacterium]
MSPIRSKSSAKASSGKRVPYKAPRPRRELYTAIAVGVVIFVVTATLVWFLRPNRESASTPVNTATVTTEAPTDTTGATDTTAAPSDTTPTDTTAPAGESTSGTTGG